MSAVHLVADSTCDISTAEAARLGLVIVPLKVIIGDEVFADGVDIDPPTLYARMRSSTVAPMRRRFSASAAILERWESKR